MTYPALFEKANDGTWGGYFPDLSGTGVAGYASPREARTSLQIVLEMHINAMREDGIVIPEPSLLELLSVA